MKTSALIPLVAYLGLAGMSSAAPIQAAEAENHLDKRTFCFFGFGWCPSTTTAAAPAKTSAASSVVISSAAKSPAITSSSAAAKSSAVVVVSSSAKASSVVPVASSTSSAKAVSTSSASKTASAGWAQCTDFDWTAWNDKEWTWGGGFSKDYVKEWYLDQYGLAPPPGMNWRQVSSLVSKFGAKTTASGPKTTSRYSKGCSNPWTSAASATKTKAVTTTSAAVTKPAVTSVAASVSKPVSSAAVSSASASPSKAAASSASASVAKPSVASSSAAGPASSSAAGPAVSSAASSSASSAAGPVASSAVAPVASSAASSAAAPVASSASSSVDAPAASSAAADSASSAAAASPSPAAPTSDSGSSGNNTGVPGTGSGIPGSGDGSNNGTSTADPVPEVTQPAPVTVNGYQYGGCAQEVSGRLLNDVQTSSASQTIESCTALCASYGFGVAGLEYGNECYCGTLDDVEDAAVSGECKMPCAGDASQICGGPNAINWYFDADLTPSTVQLPAGWTTYGVVNEGTNGRLLATQLYSSQSNTIESCAQGCAAAGYKLAGTEYSSECFCGNGFTASAGGGELVDDSAAFMSCSGNLAQKCGGPSILSITSAFGNNIPLV